MIPKHESALCYRNARREVIKHCGDQRKELVLVVRAARDYYYALQNCFDAGFNSKLEIKEYLVGNGIEL